MSDETVIVQVVDQAGRPVFTDGKMLFEVVQDGANTGARGTSEYLHRLTGRPLRWRYGFVVMAETGEVKQR